MKYFKNTKGDIFAYDDTQLGLVGDKVELTAQELEAHINPLKTAEQLQQEVNAEALVYLASTDWYVVRQAETGVIIPAEIVTARAEARLKIVGA